MKTIITEEMRTRQRAIEILKNVCYYRWELLWDNTYVTKK